LVRVEDLEVQYAIQLELHVVESDSALWLDVDRLFLERLHILDLIDAGNQPIQSGLEDFVESAHSLDHPCFLLGDEVDNRVDWHLK
ncbi:hypothetical protein PMAYCL1PPCAC_22588, partial [Pristionchus mayeri]